MIFNRKPPGILRILIAIILMWAGLQFIGPEIDSPPATGTIEAPPEIVGILERSCFDCHSNETKLKWFDKIAPVSWMVAADVNEGRSRFNFSEWNTLSPADQKAKLWEIFNFVEAGRMPLEKYTALHDEARISSADIMLLKNYVNSLSINSAGDTAKIAAADTQFKKWRSRDTTLTKSPVSPNGVPYFEDYQHWQVMSTTTRTDNGTMRVIYANDIAMRALKDNRINPWPDGATIVKVVWDKLEDDQGNVRAGKFNNVQYMIRDTGKYKNTEGWGFARFDTPDLIPYGQVASFEAQCINCHQLVKQNGFVFDISTKP